MRWPFTKHDAKDIAASATPGEPEWLVIFAVLLAIRWLWLRILKWVR